MMIRSTNQVGQMFVVNKSVAIKKLLDREGGDVKGFNLIVDDEDTTDFVTKGQILDMNVKKATDDSEILNRKYLQVKLNPDVNGGIPVAGQDYVIALKFRGDIGEEDVIEKVAMAHCYASDFVGADATAKNKAAVAKLLQRLAQSFIDNAECDAEPLYVVTTAGYAKLNDVTTVDETGFCIVEAAPYWRLGTFKESLAKIDVMTRPIILDSDEVEDWLYTHKFVKTAHGDNVPKIVNTHKVADMEYFYKGERGTSAFLNHPYDIQIPVKLKVDQDSTDGYDLITIHYYYTGANASNQKSEKDLILAIENGATFTLDGKASKKIDDFVTALKGI